MKIYRVPSVVELIYPRRLWHIPHKEKRLFLTFDDGPNEDTTQWILTQLDEWNAKGTFFCVGENIEKNEALYSQIVEKGHSVGNHTHRHLNGWEIHSDDYLEDIARCATHISTKLFRPPYGRITASQVEALLLQGYRIVMWSVLTHDYDPLLNKEKCWNNLKSNLKSGDIVVFHDSLKAHENLKYLLPKTLEHYSAQGYSFEVI
jgi:peptidoglycan/xylan/chitin deacetylase (PgdA/CDA1 family)